MTAMVWGLDNICKWVGLVLMIAGVALFGRNLIRITVAQAKAAREESLSAEIWHGHAARLATRIFCTGLALQAVAIVLALMMSGRL